MMKNKEEVTLLVIEDDDLDALAISRSFTKLKLMNKLVRAKDGVEGLEFLRGENDHEKVGKPHIILLDLNMPRMNGIEFLIELRKDPEFTSSIVFVLTTSSADKDKVAAYDKHVAGYIVKSELKTSFLEVIELMDCYWKIVTLPEQ